MNSHDWKVGQVVGVIHYGEISERRTITKVNKRFFVLDNGTQWSMDGYRYPSEPFSMWRVVTPWSEKIDIEYRTLCIQHKLTHTEWRKLQLEVLEKIESILDEHKK